MADLATITEINDVFNIGDDIEILPPVYIKSQKKISLSNTIYTLLPSKYHDDGDSTCPSGTAKVVGFHDKYVVLKFLDEKNRDSHIGIEPKYLKKLNNNSQIKNSTNEKAIANTIKVCRITPTISTGERPTGIAVRGRTSKSSVIVGHLSNTTIAE